MYLHRAIVSLPEYLCSRENPLAERVVFFETDAFKADPGVHLQQLLARVWLTDCSGWCEDGLIYNVSPEREAGGYSDNTDDTRLFEIGWADGPLYATTDQVEIYCTPRTALRLKKAMAKLPAPEAWQATA